MAKIGTLTDVGVIATAGPTINNNWDVIEAAFANTVSRDGSTPNNMNADLDLNNNDLLNANAIDCVTLTIGGKSVGSAIIDEANAAAAAAEVSATNAANSADLAANSADLAASVTALEPWSGPWRTATSYVVGALVEESGSTYICVVAHTSGVFFDDLTSSKWELFASKGNTGAGTGDVLAANNGSEYTASAGTFRNNVSAMVRAITPRTNLNIATDTTLDSSIYNMGTGNTNIPPGGMSGASMVSAKLFPDNYNYLWFHRDKAWIGKRFANVNTWWKIFTSTDATGTGDFLASMVAKPVAGDSGKVAQFDANGNVTPGFVVLDDDTMAANSATNVPSQRATKAYVNTSVSAGKFGAGKTYSNPTRVANTTYQNTTGDSIEVYIVGISNVADRSIQVSPDNVTWYTVGYISGSPSASYLRVPAGYYYRIAGTAVIHSWVEVR